MVEESDKTIVTPCLVLLYKCLNHYNFQHPFFCVLIKTARSLLRARARALLSAIIRYLNLFKKCTSFFYQPGFTGGIFFFFSFKYNLIFPIVTIPLFSIPIPL